MLSKKQQTFKHKEKVCKDKDYLQWFAQQSLPCIVCGKLPAEGHHVYSVLRGIVRDDTKIIPLCPFHHRQSVDCSPHAGKKGFLEMFSLADQLEIAEHIHKKYKHK